MHLIRRAERSTSTSSSASSISTATSGSSDALPRPFDTGLGNNFTTSTCPTFFKAFLSDETFNECVPLSLLLQTSTSFFTVQRSPVRLAQTLSASCSVNFDTCSTLMASLARQIQSPNNCAADLQNQNPVAMQAYDGFVAYQSLYHAGCLLNSETGAYCFSDAVTNATSPTDSYVYYLPLGVSLPGTTAPSCSECLRDTMSAFGSAATNRSQPVSNVFASAAAMIDLTCGADFVNASIPHQPTSAAASLASTGLGGLGSIALLVSLLTVLM
ncbi:hypothetical protein M438DRAFT_270930 [Aureobasidium pullulans EXF-150]|uniref:DUF7729 domain-containing protein n=1 Tax=Aureobasidium pullulans EXF-150 TaxID=1043002 RepID=A0A074XW68_AURPU|nr:uncharacterized protein M438DRAFT_270930 [Aureobasidium pullulans EXF-150]KEQ86127.1 hypothetical protein M438DRAFT_270930 [Aureobasidium pullulans EXF-150]